MIGREVPSLAEASIEAYEGLRAHMVAGSTSGVSGVVLLIRQGVAAWMAGRAQRSVAVVAMPSLAVEQAPSSNEMHAGVVRVLASIVLATRREMSA